MKQNKCPFWDEKKGRCKLTELIKEMADISLIAVKIAQAYAPKSVNFAPPPSESPVQKSENPLKGMLQGFSQALGKNTPPPFPWVDEDDSKKKQEYWEKEL
jgi:hypothetical protein